MRRLRRYGVCVGLVAAFTAVFATSAWSRARSLPVPVLKVTVGQDGSLTATWTKGDGEDSYDLYWNTDGGLARVVAPVGCSYDPNTLCVGQDWAFPSQGVPLACKWYEDKSNTPTGGKECTGYEDLADAQTTATVSGLQAGATYYLQVLVADHCFTLLDCPHGLSSPEYWSAVVQVVDTPPAVTKSTGRSKPVTTKPKPKRKHKRVLAARSSRPHANSPACTAALNRIATDQKAIARLQANLKFKNPHPDVEKVRERQINLQLARLNADLAAANTAKAKACGPDQTTFDGTWTATFDGTTHAVVNFTVRNAVISGGMTGTIVVATGNTANLRSDFGVGANCNGSMHFNANGTATSAPGAVTCALMGQKATETVTDAHRTGP